MTNTSRIANRLAAVLGFDQVAVTATAFETESESYIITKGTGEGDFAYIADDVERFCEGREKADYSADFCQAVDPVEALSVLRAESKHAFAEKITIDPSDPFAGLVTPEDQGEVLAGWIREKGAERLAVELLSEASGAGCGTWDDYALRALTAALEDHVHTP